MAQDAQSTLYDELVRKILVLSEIAWENLVKKPNLDNWLANFRTSDEKLHALFLISQFMYFGSREVRALLKSLYRDLFKYPRIEQIRKVNHDSLDSSLIESVFHDALSKTRFLGVGNPSESGVHLLYYFRQENRLPKNLFIHSYQLFDRYGSAGQLQLGNPGINHYVFLDDMCGSGKQAARYAGRIVDELKKLNKNARVEYLTLFATTQGKNFLRKVTRFDNIDSVFELDESFECFHSTSRYFPADIGVIKRDVARDMCISYGKELMRVICELEGVLGPDLDKCARRHALGFDNGQLLIGFHHNTPDNSLPVIWFDEAERYPWVPIFRRYNKNYGI
jgi:hypothetical protein